MNNTMTFHESYGTMPVKTLRLIRKCNVSPADYDFIMMESSRVFGEEGEIDWTVINEHIISNSETGMYRPRFF